MEDEKRYTEAEAHRRFAVQYHGKTWDLLDKAERSREEDELMIHSAHASCRHWLEVGTEVNHQRGEWLLARVYTVAQRPDAALAHALRCMELTNAHPDAMVDFDRAFAHECVARAQALAGDLASARLSYAKARLAGEVIEDTDDRAVFVAELKGGEWYGLAPA